MNNELNVIEYKNIRVLTTQQLANAYGTSTDIITRNFNRNKDRYVKGKHYIALKGEEKNAFVNLGQFDRGLKNAKTLYLWTEKGAFLHAKSLNTDTAWEVYDRLVDSYFSKKADLFNSTYQGKSLPMNYKEALVQLVEQVEINEQLESTIEKNKPLVKFASTVTKAENTIDMNSMAKMIQEKNHINIGRNRLYEFLRKKKILMKNNEPYQDYIERGWFKVIEIVIQKGNKSETGSKTLITGFGQVKITNLIVNEFENALAVMQ